MSNEVTSFQGGVPATADELLAGLQNVSANLHSGTGGMPFLRLLKDGHFVYGPESIEVEEGSEWAINPASLQHGYACWGESELLDEVMVPSNQAKPPRSELNDMGFPWSEQVAVVVRCVSGEDEGLQALYKGTSLGMRNAIKELIGELVAQLQKDPEHPVPIVELETDNYKHPKYGKTYIPILRIQRWVGWDSPENVGDALTDSGQRSAADDKDPGEGPTRSRRRAGGTEDAKAEKPAPRRRRRVAQ